jgi:hypothetical protein
MWYGKSASRSKFGAIKTVIDGITFSSRAEARRYGELKLLLRAKQISDLKLQPRFLLQQSFKYGGKTERAIEYVADFQYVAGKDGSTRYEVVEDVKGFKTAEYKLKRKMFLHMYGTQYHFVESK